MEHVFYPGIGLPILTLHGTGGDEHDLVPLVRAIAPGRPILSPRGQVKEGNANRFFRRFGEGRFDPKEVAQRAGELADFVAWAGATYGFEPVLDALGYSNGANIAGALMLVRPGVIRKAVLLRAMLALEPETTPDLKGSSVLVLSGERDSIIPKDSTRALVDLLRLGGAMVDPKVLPGDHGLTQADIGLSATFMS